MFDNFERRVNLVLIVRWSISILLLSNVEQRVLEHFHWRVQEISKRRFSHSLMEEKEKAELLEVVQLLFHRIELFSEDHSDDFPFLSTKLQREFFGFHVYVPDELEESSLKRRGKE